MSKYPIKTMKYFRAWRWGWEINDMRKICFIKNLLGFPWWLSGKESANEGDVCIPDLGGSHMLQSQWGHVPQLLSLSVALEPGSYNYGAHVLQLLKSASPRAHALQQEKPPQWEALVLQLEKSPHNKDPVWPETNTIMYCFVVLSIAL